MIKPKRMKPIITVVLLVGSITLLLNTPLIPSQDEWHEKLPHCPCENPDLKQIALNDGWAQDVGNIKKYHSGATTCFRSYPPVKTSEGMSGQQCCYDSLGNLIKCGSGAGTPDRASTCLGEDSMGIMTLNKNGVFAHLYKDVLPWHKKGWREYNKIWVPNKGQDCKE